MIKEIDYERSTSDPTTALVPIARSSLRADTSAMLIGSVGGVLIGAILFALGFLTGVMWQDRGWGALIVFSVVLAAVTVSGRNARIA